MTFVIAFGVEDGLERGPTGIKKVSVTQTESRIYTKNLGIHTLIWGNKHQDVESVTKILIYDMVFRIEERLKCRL